MGAADWPNSSGIRLSLIQIFLDCRTSCNRSPPPCSGPRHINHAEGWELRPTLALENCGNCGPPLVCEAGTQGH